MDKKGKGGKGGKDDKKGGKGGKEAEMGTCNFVKARHILSEKLSIIEDVYNKILEEAGTRPSPSIFSKYATEFSECSSKNKGGNLGFFGRGSMVGAFEEIAFSLPPGTMSNVVKTKHGYHLILVEERKATK